MKSVLALAVAVLAAGCATPQEPAQSFDEALPYLSAMDVCEAVLFAPPGYAGPAQEEATKRRLNCGELAAAVAQHRDARAAAAPVIPVASPRRSCRTVAIGSTLQTSCM